MGIWRFKMARLAMVVLGGFAGCALIPSAQAATNAPPLFFVQISDTHRGLPLHTTRLERAIDQINALTQSVQCVIHTGDFASDDLRTGTAATISNQLARLIPPVFKVPGNHDIKPRRLQETVEAYTNYLGPLACRMEVQGIQFLMVYTEPLRKGIEIPGYDPIAWLSAQLRAHPTQETIIVTHAPDVPDFYNQAFHPGWPEASLRAWLETLKLGNIKAIITGHFHRDELHWNELGIPTYVASSIAGFWGRQGSFRIYRYEKGLLSYATVYLDDAADPQ